MYRRCKASRSSIPQRLALLHRPWQTGEGGGRVEPEGERRWPVPRPFEAAGRFIVGLLWRFIADHCLLHASALTYTSLLSIVPLLAIVFSVLKGLGAQRQIAPLLLSRVALEPETAERLLGYIDRTNVGTLGALGAVALLTTVISVLGAIEQSFNHIWRVAI